MLLDEELAGLIPLIRLREYLPKTFDNCFKECLVLMEGAYQCDEERVESAYKGYSDLFSELSSAIRSIEGTLSQLDGSKAWEICHRLRESIR